jgi:hypothetical protein
MTTFSDSCVSMLVAIPTPQHDLDIAHRRWRLLRTSLFDPYHPELHYMRGPGPKWREKHVRCCGR